MQSEKRVQIMFQTVLNEVIANTESNSITTIDTLEVFTSWVKEYADSIGYEIPVKAIDVLYYVYCEILRVTGIPFSNDNER